MDAGHERSRWKILLAFAIIYFVWGSTYLAIRVGVREVPPLLFAAMRFLIAGLVLFGWMLARGAGFPTAPQWGSAFLLGFLIFVLDYGSLFWAEQRVPSGIAAVMLALIPAFISLSEIFIPRSQALTLRLALALLTGLAGIAVLMSQTIDLGGGPINKAGAIALLVAAASWSIASVLTRRLPLPVSKVMSSGAQMLAGGILLTATAGAFGEFRGFQPASVSTGVWLALAYLIVAGSIIGFTAYLWLIHHESPTKVGTYAYVNPVVAVIVGYFLGGEDLGIRTVLGTLLVLVSVAVITMTGLTFKNMKKLLLFAACLAIIAVPARSQYEEKIIGGPYAVNVSSRSATVMWVVEKFEATLGTAPGKVEKTAPVLHTEKAVFQGLTSGTTYYYQAFPGEAGKGSFKTPAAAGQPYQFVVYGDTRTRHDVHRKVIQGLLAHSAPDFIVHTGDLVADGDDPSLWPIFFEAERELLRKAAIFPALGNHERHAPAYFDFMNAKPWSSFDWGGAHFTVIDSDIGTMAATQVERDAMWKEQTQWLERDLRDAEKAEFRFVFAHHPPMTAVKSRQGDNPHMIALEPMFEKYHVAAGFFGHDHNYQHYFKKGIHYYVTGGGGAPLYDVDSPPESVRKVESTENFVVVKVDGKTVRIDALRPDGTTIDTTEIGK